MKLPSNSFTPFAAQRLTSPTVAWVNEGKFTYDQALANAYCTRSSHEPESAFLADEEQVLLADRYGGAGVGYCGGSARCGIFGGIQIKGAGKNQLHGSKPGSPPVVRHSSGTMYLKDAACEAIWSSICNAALPFGALPSLAIVLTGTRVCAGTYKTAENAGLRALLLRPTALRPAHYLRNLYFQFGAIPTKPISEDAMRAGSAVAGLADSFVEELGVNPSGSTQTQIVSTGLQRMAERYAAQLAASLAKRIFHGALCCSNIALDGKFLDFGTTGAVVGYRRIVAGTDQWRQDTAIITTLSSLRAHVSRYLRCADMHRLISRDELIAQFTAALQESVEIEFLKLTGVPKSTLIEYPKSARTEVFRCFREVFSRGARTPFVWKSDDDESVTHLTPLTSVGRYDLNQALIAAVLAAGLNGNPVAENYAVDDQKLAARLQFACSDVLNWHLRNFEVVNKVTELTKVLSRVRRLNSDVSFLTRESLYSILRDVDQKPEMVGSKINATISRALPIVSDAVDDAHCLGEFALQEPKREMTQL
jgi:hypothetical protein